MRIVIPVRKKMSEKHLQDAVFSPDLPLYFNERWAGSDAHYKAETSRRDLIRKVRKSRR